MNTLIPPSQWIWLPAYLAQWLSSLSYFRLLTYLTITTILYSFSYLSITLKKETSRAVNFPIIIITYPGGALYMKPENPLPLFDNTVTINKSPITKHLFNIYIMLFPNNLGNTELSTQYNHHSPAAFFILSDARSSSSYKKTFSEWRYFNISLDISDAKLPLIGPQLPSRNI